MSKHSADNVPLPAREGVALWIAQIDLNSGKRYTILCRGDYDEAEEIGLQFAKELNEKDDKVVKFDIVRYGGE